MSLGGTVDIYPPAGITEIIGTENQIAANGDYLNGQIGPSVQLSLPQDINISSSPQFSFVLLTHTDTSNGTDNIINARNTPKGWAKIKLQNTPILMDSFNIGNPTWINSSTLAVSASLPLAVVNSGSINAYINYEDILSSGNPLMHPVIVDILQVQNKVTSFKIKFSD